jgi:3-oxosteroid 1-dehydrogenase
VAEWDHLTDFLVVGSGGGLAGAVIASRAGLDVLVVEKSECIGGSTGMSGGVLWLPNNPLMQREHVPDSLDEALDYFATVVGAAGPASSEARRRAYVLGGVSMIDALEREGMTFVRCEGYSDYYTDIPGVRGASARGRAIECVPTDTKRIGPLAAKLRPAPAAPLVLRTGEVATMSLLRTRAGQTMAVRVGTRTIVSRLRNQHLTTNGGALVTQLLEVLLRHEVPIWTNARFVDLIQENGRVLGVMVHRRGVPTRIRARRGVLIATGGFAHNGPMRRKYGQDPNDGQWTTSNPGDTGEVLEAIMDHGAATDLMDAAWWIPTLLGPDDTRHQSNTRLMPGSIIVDSSGRRYMNESADYVRCGYEMYKREREEGTGIPSWTIFDQRHRSHYLFGKHPPGKAPKDWISSGHLKSSRTITGLAEQCGIDPGTLAATIERFNALAAAGVDEDFHRGETAHEKYYGDFSQKPNPCLAPIARPPFFAVQTFPGDVGTSGGLLCNEHSQVLGLKGEPIPGLYAAGNVTASVMGRTYPGAGASIGASTVFSCIAATHAGEK